MVAILFVIGFLFLLKAIFESVFGSSLKQDEYYPKQRSKGDTITNITNNNLYITSEVLEDIVKDNKENSQS